MVYQVSRNGQLYGPYTLEDLNRYVASGNVQLTDLAKSEEMTQWVPVSQIVGAPAAPPPQTFGSPTAFGIPPVPVYAPGAPGAAAYDSPPNLHWGLVLLFAVLTCSLFMYIWNLILAAWANRVVPGSKVLIAYIVATVLVLVQGFAGAKVSLSFGQSIGHNPFLGPHLTASYLVICIVCWITRLIARFTMRNTLERHYNTAEPIGLRLSGVMTFFFGGLYFQYHLNRINELKRSMGFRPAGY